MKRTATLAYVGMVGVLLVGTGCVAGRVTNGTGASPTTSTSTVTRTATIISAVTPTVPSSADLTATAQASVATSPPTFTTGGADEADGHAAFNQVDEVTDGDTIRVFIDDHSTPVRILGINTPETVKPGTPVECYGPEASAKMHDLVDGTGVILTIDPTQGSGEEHQDRYGRWLRYVTTGDTGVDVSEYMLRYGFARKVNYDGPTERDAVYESAQTTAETLRIGGWAACGW